MAREAGSVTARGARLGLGAQGALGALAAAQLSLAGCGDARVPPARASSASSAGTSSASSASSAPSASSGGAPRLASPSPGAPRASPGLERALDQAAATAIEKGQVPGAVIVALEAGHVVLEKAYGHRALAAGRGVEPMTVETSFDLASLTKPLATATSLVLLAERGLVSFGERASKHLPRLARARDPRLRAVTLEQLAVHSSGLPAAMPVGRFGAGLAGAVDAIAELELEAAPGERQRYSDLGYVLLGAVVEAVAREGLERFAAREIFAPLGMHDTSFVPPPERRARAAPTEVRGGALLRGVVHDPSAAALGGVAGHAGLFSTGRDLARYLEALVREPTSLLSGPTRDTLVATRPAGRGANGPVRRSLAFAESPPGLSHTGFTGTYVWLDAKTRSGVVVLTNRVHLGARGDATELRKAAVRAMVDADRARAAAPSVGAAPRVVVGVDVLLERAAPLDGLRVALLANDASRTREGERTADALRRALGPRLVKLLSPEHGASARHEGAQGDARDPRTGLAVTSLYGAKTRPSREDLRDVDAVVVDLVDAGTRSFTYESTLAELVRACARDGKRLVVLDRPNPQGGALVSGPVTAPSRRSFVAGVTTPLVHGLTLGELARFVARDEGLALTLEVVPVRGLERSMRVGDTGLPWIAPSPNLVSARAAALYPGVALVELTNVSVGRGTGRPFELVGAPFIDGARLAEALGAERVAGLAVRPATFVPSASTHAGKRCSGVLLEARDPAALDPVRVGYALARALGRRYPNDWKAAHLPVLLADDRVASALLRGASDAELDALLGREHARFRVAREPALLYR